MRTTKKIFEKKKDRYLHCHILKCVTVLKSNGIMLLHEYADTEGTNKKPHQLEFGSPAMTNKQHNNGLISIEAYFSLIY